MSTLNRGRPSHGRVVANKSIPDWCARKIPTSRLLSTARLQPYGYGVAAVYAVFLVSAYRAGSWILDARGVPIYTDFACAWMAGLQAIHGQAASLYDPAKFVEIQRTLVGPSDEIYPNWPYPPTFFLILAPFSALGYLPAFIAWDAITLLGCVILVYAITRRSAAIALLFASPFTVWNFLAGQNGFLTGSLLGASLLFLERRPVLAGLFIGCLTYKPQFGVLFPVVLLAAREWRAIASAAITAALLAGVAATAFGTGAWTVFPRELVAQARLNLLADPDSNWGYLQTVYGLARTLHGSTALAWLAQGAVTFGIAVIVWFVWRSPISFSLKAATLSTAALMATPYAFAYDLAAIVVPAAFLARDQMRCGLLKGEQTIMIGLFGAVLAALVVFRDPPDGVTFGGMPTGSVVMITLLGIILRRALWQKRKSAFMRAARSELRRVPRYA
jgi:arabinofuranan 3-O-arabinosyltransferase